MATPGEPNDSSGDQLNLRPGSQTGWDPTSLEGADRCRAFGHELGDILEMPNGLLVAYCVRCPERFEATWFRGGTAVPLAEEMVKEVDKMRNPAPTVMEDLRQVLGLLTEDRSAIDGAIHKVRATMMKLQKNR